MRLILAYLCLAVVACGGKGESGGADQGASPDPAEPGLLPPVESWVEGRLPEDLSLWLMDHLTCHVRVVPVDAQGYFAIAVDHFEPKHVYSFEVVDRNLVHLGRVDFSERKGLQSSVTFYGGLGFDLGNIQKPAKPSSSSGFLAKLDGGFRLSSKQHFLDASRPCASSLAHVASPTLSVLNSNDLFYAFFYKDRSLQRYVAELDRYSGLALSLQSKLKQPLERVRLYMGAPNILLADTADGLSWRDIDFKWTNINNHNAKQVLSLPSRYRLGDSFLTEVTIAGGNVVTLATKIAHYLSQPPKLVSWCQIGECSNILYDRIDEANGLTNPLVVSADDDLTLHIQRPLRHDQGALTLPLGAALRVRLHAASSLAMKAFKVDLKVHPDSQIDEMTIRAIDLKKIADVSNLKNPIKFEYVYITPDGLEIAGAIMSIDLTQSNSWSVNSY